MTDDTREASPEVLAGLHPLAREVPNIDAASAEIARFRAEMTLPRPTIHIISDIHGEDKKLRHVINNASGTLRQLVERLFGATMTPAEMQSFLTLVFYPAEVLDELQRQMRSVDEVRDYANSVLHDLFEVVRVLAARRSAKHAVRLFPADYRELFVEILYGPSIGRERSYVEALVDSLAQDGRVLRLVHLTVRVIRNLTIDEIIIAGDCWDRGPRGDRVLDYLMKQRNVAFVWGNHDMAWLGACLGQEALVCHAIRISIRYRRMAQIEAGYGIALSPLQRLAEAVYADDPATGFAVKGDGPRDSLLLARMQKAVAVMQFKLEGQAIARHPEWEMDHRRLLHRVDLNRGVIAIDGVEHLLIEATLPTLDPTDPYALSPEGATCIARLRRAFMDSQTLWEHMRWMVQYGRMYLIRDENLIFHGCLAVDEDGAFLPMMVGDEGLTGRKLFQAIEGEVYRMMDRPGTLKELDLLWYLWCGPRSPLFGKDRITTLEQALIRDKHTHGERKNPYFRLIEEEWFCDQVLAEFGIVSSAGLIVNGHVPVAIEKGEHPLKQSGKAVTIDGAFSEAYGDRGFTLVIEPERTFIATHSHFDSVEAAVHEGADIIPTIEVIRQ